VAATILASEICFYRSGTCACAFTVPFRYVCCFYAFGPKVCRRAFLYLKIKRKDSSEEINRAIDRQYFCCRMKWQEALAIAYFVLFSAAN
jgi:hypothetical protein